MWGSVSSTGRLSPLPAGEARLDCEPLSTAVCARSCVGNRHYVEESWQTVANNFFDAKGVFSQAAWSAQLKEAMT